MAMQNFGGVNKVHYGLCESSETIRKPKVSTKIFCTEINFFLRTPAGNKPCLLRSRPATCCFLCRRADQSG